LSPGRLGPAEVSTVAGRATYGVIVNPVAGPLPPNEKHRIARRIADMLAPQCPVVGMDTASPAEFGDCARELSAKVDVLVVAGGDGTFVDVLNAIDPSVVLSYVPLGSGNALRYALRLPRRLDQIVSRIKDGEERALDLILCDDARRALFASIGIDGEIARVRDDYLRRNVSGLPAYALAVIKAVAKGHNRTQSAITIDDETIEVDNAISIMVAKIPYYGYRLNVMPEARLADGYLHLRYITSGLLGCACCVATSWLGGNRIGVHHTARNVRVVTEEAVYLQIQGTIHRQGTQFEFRVLPGALRMRC
jgi:diacylglycerol kinase (ATP)